MSFISFHMAPRGAGSISSAFIIGCASRGSGGVVGICRSGRPGGRWPRSEARSATGRPAGSPGCRSRTPSRASTTQSVVGELLPVRKLRAEALADRRLRPRTPRDPRQRQARTHRPQLGHPLRPRMVHQNRRLPPLRNGPTHHCVCPPVNDVGELCAGEPHAQFDAAAGGNHSQSGQHAPRGRGSLPPTLQSTLRQPATESGWKQGGLRSRRGKPYVDSGSEPRSSCGRFALAR